MENYEKKYKNALEWARQVMNGETGFIRDDVLDVFPELKESEDDRIRKALITYFQRFPYPYGGIESAGTNAKEAIAWLEKQQSVEEIVARCKDSWYNEGKIAGMAEGLSDDEKYQQGWHDAIEKQEEKVDNANMIEPKFHEGEWIVWQDKCYKVNYNGCGYELVDQNGLSTSLEYGTVDENAHHWDITKDAEDGDVLVSDNIIFIFNKIHDVWIKCHCSLYEDGSFYGGDFDLMHVKYGKEVFPATKEQRDKLLKAMADAGWQFDFDKKEFKKVEPNSAWSEEDEKNLTRTIWYVENPALNVVKDIMLSEWLKSIKGRVQPQPHWKPSEEQIDALEHYVRGIGESGYVSPYDVNLNLVHSLLNDLKKLKGE